MRREGPSRALVAAAAFAVLAAGLGLVPQRLLADQRVTTRAEVVAAFRVTIDIKPGSNPNSINLSCQGNIPVAILTTAEFDASTVDPGTAIFTEATAVQSALEDVDGDADFDLILHFKCQEVSIPSDAIQTCVQGRTYQGVSIVGCDSVRIVPPDRAAGGGAAARPIATPALAGAVFAPTPIGTPSPGPATGGTPIATPDLGGAGLAPETIATPSPGPAEGATPAATPRSNPVLFPLWGGDGDLSNDGGSWLALLVGGGLPLTLMVGLVWFLRPRRR